MEPNSPDIPLPRDEILAALKTMRSKKLGGRLATPVARRLAALAGKAEKALEKGDLGAVDAAMTVALLEIKRGLGSTIDVRTAHDVASLVFEGVKRYVAPAAGLFLEVQDFARAFVPRMLEDRVEGGGIDYLHRRPFPTAYRGAFEQMRREVRAYEIPDERLHPILVTLDELEELAGVVSDGQPTPEQNDAADFLVRSLAISILALEGVYLTAAQTSALQAIIILAWPGWLCWNLVSWLIQLGVVIVVVLVGREKFSITVASSTGGPPVFREGGPNLADIDISVTATTSEPTHAPVTVSIVGLAAHDHRGTRGNVVTDVLTSPNLTRAGNGTATATATATQVPGGNQGLLPGISELDVTITATCAQGHSTTVTETIKYTR